MQNQLKLIAAVLTLALLAAAAGAQQLLPPASGDLAATTLVAATQAKGAALSGRTVSREPVSLSWPLAGDIALDGRAEPFSSRSKEYFVDVTAEALRRGVALHTTAPGALVRLNPAAGDDLAGAADKAAIAPDSLVLTAPSGRAFGAGSGMDQMAGPRELEAASAPFAEGTSAFRIREELGAGTFELRAEGLAADAGRRYVVHVFDRLSPIELVLRTTETDYLHGQTLTVEAALTDGTRRLRARRVEGFVTSPAGRAWPLAFRYAGDGLYRASLELDAVEAPAPGLWQVEASVQALQPGLSIRRAGHTAFGCALPSARLAGGATVDAAGDGLGVRLAVEAASAGRYEARGVLWGTAADGSLRPAAVADSAAWLEAGAGSLELAFGPDLLRGLGAPFEIRDLRLVDQGRMGLLHRQRRALEIGR